MNKHILTILTATGLLVGCQKSVQTASERFNELPPAVQRTVRAQAPNAEIADVTQTTQNGAQVYEVQLRGDGQNPKIVVAADGTLVSTDMPKTAGTLKKMLTPTGAVGTPLSALPEAAQKTIQAHAPNAQIAGISRHNVNGRVIYEVEFADKGKNPTIQVAEDGTLVQDLQK